MFARIIAKLFGMGGSGGESGKLPESTSYEGFLIYPMPKKEGGQWLTAGLITKEIDGELKEHNFIRADKHSSREDASNFAITKARQIIDQQKDNVFDQ